MAGTDGYCFSGSPSLTCISLKFDVCVFVINKFFFFFFFFWFCASSCHGRLWGC